MKILSSLTSPYGRKARIVLLEKKIDCQLDVDIPWDEDSQVPEYNPLGKVPVLYVPIFAFPTTMASSFCNG